jgi:hypothetical protein
MLIFSLLPNKNSFIYNLFPSLYGSAHIVSGQRFLDLNARMIDLIQIRHTPEQLSKIPPQTGFSTGR